MPALDENGHLTIEKRQQQRPDVASVNIRVTHQKDAVVAQSIHIKIVASDAATQCSNQRADFRGRQHFVEASLFDVKNFSLQRQDRLRAPIAALLCGTTGGITFDEENLR